MGNQDSVNSITCGRALTVASVGELYGELRDAMATGQSVSVDLSAVDAVDAAGMQMLLIYHQDAAARGVTVQWSSMSDVCKQAAKTLGIDGMLGW